MTNAMKPAKRSIITPDKIETRDRFHTIQNSAVRRLKNHEKHVRKLFG